MLSGHVDKIASDMIAGWAADDEDHNRIVHVEVYVGAKHYSDVACDRLRNDLKLAGMGEGKHGFVYRWPEALPSERLSDVKVMFAGTTMSLTQPAKALVNPVAAPAPPASAARTQSPAATPAPRPAGVRQLMTLACPQTMRDLFELVALHGSSESMRDLVGRIAKPAPPAAASSSPLLAILEPELRAANGDFPKALNAFLHRRAFQENILPSLLKAFPEKRRLVFLHVPKCAGTDLGHKLARMYPSVSANLARPQLTPPAQLFAQIADIVRHLPLSDAILLRDHLQLSYFIEKDLLRSTDEVFTVVRPPVQLVVSQLNYVCTRLENDARAGAFAADTRGWANTLGVDVSTISAMDAAGMQDLGRKMLTNPAIVLPNLICYWLGGGTAEAVRDRLVANAVEIVHIDHYSAWLQSRWGIQSAARLNVSKKFFTEDSFDENERAYIRDVCAEDTRLMELLFPGDA